MCRKYGIFSSNLSIKFRNFLCHVDATAIEMVNKLYKYIRNKQIDIDEWALRIRRTTEMQQTCSDRKCMEIYGKCLFIH